MKARSVTCSSLCTVIAATQGDSMTTPRTKLGKLFDATERLGVIGSPSSTAELSLDVLGSAVTRKLLGELALFRFLQDSDPHYALGQITEIQLKNVWHEDPTMRSLIRQRGRVDAVSERQDTHLGKMIVSAVFREGGNSRYEPSILGTVPSTGTLIHIGTDEVLDELLRPYRDQTFYLGTSTVRSHAFPCGSSTSTRDPTARAKPITSASSARPDRASQCWLRRFCLPTRAIPEWRCWSSTHKASSRGT